jgi:hypothetical protein
VIREGDRIRDIDPRMRQQPHTRGKWSKRRI